MRTHAAAYDPDRPEAIMVSVRCCDPSFKITFLAAPHALDFEDEQKIGGRDAVSSRQKSYAIDSAA